MSDVIPRDFLLAEIARALRPSSASAEEMLRDLEIWISDDFASGPTLPIAKVVSETEKALRVAFPERAAALVGALDELIRDVRRVAETVWWCLERGSVEQMGELGDPRHDPACFFDPADHPPWGAWIRALASTDPLHPRALLFWVPREMISFVEDAIAIQAAPCIRWIDADILVRFPEIPGCIRRLCTL